MTRLSLSEFLTKKAEEYAEETKGNRDVINEWVSAVHELFVTLRGWIANSDPAGILEVKESQAEVSEPNLGRYQVPRLEIRAFGKWVGIIPKARKTIKTARPPQQGAPDRATGRIDITDEIRRYVLYRESPNSWFIEGPSHTAHEPLTKELFEEALMSYFE